MKPPSTLSSKAADLRKKAADLSTQMDDIDAKLMLFQQDLQVHQAQQKQLTEAIGRLDEAVKQTNGGWDTIQKQIQPTASFRRRLPEQMPVLPPQPCRSEMSCPPPSAKGWRAE